MKVFICTSHYSEPGTHALNETDKKVWERQIDCYGRLRNSDNKFVPFLYSWQYVDEETGLVDNKFR